MATVDSSIDGTMTVLILDKDEAEALRDVLIDTYVGANPQFPAVLEEMYNAL